MERSNPLRNVWLFVAGGAWLFLLLSLASFNPGDWPSHQVYPFSPVQNLCGSAGAFVAYYLFLSVGQGVFPPPKSLNQTRHLKCQPKAPAPRSMTWPGLPSKRRARLDPTCRRPIRWQKLGAKCGGTSWPPSFQ